MTMATLWNNCKPTTFLTSCGASAFKIIQTSGYFENWEATLKALDTPQVFLTIDKELKWCQHSRPNLKKVPNKTKVKNVPDKKSGNSRQQSGYVNFKKKDHKSSPNANKQASPTKDLLKDPKLQKSKSNKKIKSKGGSKDNKEVLAEILALLRNLV
ncbi:unnamed protein product [Rhizophagus irregularis]|nr:unnamed protein product [Rhizophagus irregularis]